ncbi:Tfp pilus assembly protein FimT/FimU [Synechococcus sp. A10-1-5-9]|uniref:pilus assembly FimT family protein n=1 Tax=Synechococcus sp. A10-1-5-9 TaxID=3392295 RepID=UPI0039E72DF9
MVVTTRDSKTNSGFTLIELLAVMIIAGILSGIAIPSFQRNWQQERLKAATREAANWIEDIRLRAVQQAQICIIQVIDSTASLEPTPNTSNCNNISTLKLREIVENSEQLVICSQTALAPSTFKCTKENNNALPTEIVFTPRGTVSKGGLIKLHFSPDIPNRCIAIIQPLGLVRQGIERSSGCDYNTAF